MPKHGGGGGGGGKKGGDRRSQKHKVEPMDTGSDGLPGWKLPPTGMDLATAQAVQHMQYTGNANQPPPIQAQQLMQSPKRQKRDAMTEAFLLSQGNSFKMTTIPQGSMTKIIDYVNISHNILTRIMDTFDTLDVDKNGAIGLADFGFTYNSTIQYQQFITQILSFYTDVLGLNMKTIKDGSWDIDRADFVKCVKNSILNEIQGIRWNPHAEGLDGHYLGKIKQSIEAKLEEKALAILLKIQAQVKDYQVGPVAQDFVAYPDHGDDFTRLFAIPFDPEVWNRLNLLWSFLDVNGDGSLTVTDFAKQGDSMVSFWEEMRAFFDQNGDGVVSQDEFIGGFRKYAMTHVPIPVPQSQSATGELILESLQDMARLANEGVLLLVQKVVDMNENFRDHMSRLGSTNPQTKSPPAEAPAEAEERHPFGEITIDQSIALKMQEVFQLIDKDNSGRVEIADFLAESERSGAAVDKFKSFLSIGFDQDKDGIVTFKEFKDKLLQKVMQHTFPKVDPGTPQDQIKQISYTINQALDGMLQDLIGEFA